MSPPCFQSFVVGKIMEKSIPKYIFDKVTDVTPEKLRKMGVAAIGIDLDNTTVYDCTFRPREGVLEWLSSIKRSGIPIIIITNTYKIRAKIIAKKFGVPFVALSKKPNPKNVIRAAEKLQVPIESFALLGDQLFADVEAANSCGAISIWIRPFMREIIFGRHFARIRESEKEYCEKHGIEYKELFRD